MQLDFTAGCQPAAYATGGRTAESAVARGGIMSYATIAAGAQGIDRDERP